MILIDTDVAVDILRGIPEAESWVVERADQPILIPGLVAMELLQGAQDKRDLNRTIKFLKPFPLVWPDEAAQELAMEIFARCHLSHSMGMVDALVAATAIGESLPLHTFNKKHYSGWKGLKTIQPYRRSRR